MLDNQIYALLITAIRTGLTANGFVDVTIPDPTDIKQSYQPTQQGVSTNPTVYLNKVPGDHRYGFPQRKNTWDENLQTMSYTEMQMYISTFQISTLVKQNPADVAALTASDLANIVAGILQSADTQNFLKDNDIGILKVQDVRNPYFVDDKNQFEAYPNFDFQLTHKQSIIKTTPVVKTVEYNILSV